MQASVSVDPVPAGMDRCLAPSSPSGWGGGGGHGRGFSSHDHGLRCEPGVEEELTVIAKTYASVAGSRPAKAARQGPSETMEILDGHFHLDRLLGGQATVSDMLQMPLPRASKSAGELTGGIVVFCNSQQRLVYTLSTRPAGITGRWRPLNACKEAPRLKPWALTSRRGMSLSRNRFSSPCSGDLLTRPDP
ncbi:hypothetical protein PoB_005093600 [Plakobranchus ocellatus]|uniref:Uncharacterized protein n=1 Tax=Plakobranchus ocellatus TaxID=259542 RepID=A0AAV4BMB3_9GAST|nr:hypothetical protein PoB_005093600 [Plakobranchus ocellatus]